MIHFWCDNCGKTFKTDEDQAGKKWTCPKCGNISAIPVPISVAPVAKPKHAPARKPKPSKPHRKSPPRTQTMPEATPVTPAKVPAPAAVRAAPHKSASDASLSIKTPPEKQPSNPKDASQDNRTPAHPAKEQRQCSYAPPSEVGLFHKITTFAYISGAAVILTIAALLYFFLR
jgi:DNA-directed RNA polymerase subunit M/transcription elongation factor TFIIS